MIQAALLTARDVMTRDVATVTPEMSLLEAVKIMAGRGISAIPVLDDHGQIVGMISEGDLMRWHEGFSERQARWLDMLAEGGELSPIFVNAMMLEIHKIRAVMTHGAITVGEDTPLREVAGLMITKGIEHAPVVREGALVGIVARPDLVRALARLLAQQRAEA